MEETREGMKEGSEIRKRDEMKERAKKGRNDK